VKIGLALGSGAARGLAHIGVLKVLKQNNVHIDFIAGTSIGAIVGAIYAAGIDPNVMEEIAMSLTPAKIALLFAPTFPFSGLIDGKRVRDFLESIIGNPNIEDLKIPFAAIATDISTGQEVVITKGSVLDAIRASMSIPGMFTPYEHNGTFLVDGGLVNPLPINVVRSMGANFVIAVNVFPPPVMKSYKFVTKKERKTIIPLSPEPKSVSRKLKQLLKPTEKFIENPFFGNLRKFQHTPNVFTIILQSIAIMEYQILKLQMKNYKPNVLIEPNVGFIKPLEFYRGKEAIAAGERSCQENLRKIKKSRSFLQIKLKRTK